MINYEQIKPEQNKTSLVFHNFINFNGNQPNIHILTSNSCSVNLLKRKMVKKCKRHSIFISQVQQKVIITKTYKTQDLRSGKLTCTRLVIPSMKLKQELKNMWYEH